MLPQKFSAATTWTLPLVPVPEPEEPQPAPRSAATSAAARTARTAAAGILTNPLEILIDSGGWSISLAHASCASGVPKSPKRPPVRGGRSAPPPLPGEGDVVRRPQRHP